MMEFGFLLKNLEKSKLLEKISISTGNFLAEKNFRMASKLTKPIFIKYLNAEDGVRDLGDSFAIFFQ